MRQARHVNMPDYTVVAGFDIAGVTLQPSLATTFSAVRRLPRGRLMSLMATTYAQDMLIRCQQQLICCYAIRFMPHTCHALPGIVTRRQQRR